MTQENSLKVPPVTSSLVKSVFIGAGIAFVLIALFVLPVEGKVEWGPYWKIRPLLVVSLAGAVGGVFFYFMQNQGYQNGWRMLSHLICLIVYVVGLWMGSVIGLNGTLWN